MDNKTVYNIGILIGNAYTSYPQEMIQGFCQGAKEKNCNLFFFLGTQGSVFSQDMYGYKIDDEYDYQSSVIYDYAVQSQMDALIISYGTIYIPEGISRNDFLKKFSSVPYVVLGERVDELNSNYVISDNYHGMKSVLEHLIKDHGYKKILFLAGPSDNNDSNERLAAYKDCMMENSLDIQSSMIAYGNYSAYVADQVNELLDQNPDAQAICCANDEMAIGVYEVCKKRGLVVGKDIAVTGYDDFNKALNMNPPLTTVAQNGYDIGYLTINKAIEICKNNTGIKIEYPSCLKIRRSCGCLEQFDMINLSFSDNQGRKAYIDNKTNQIQKECMLQKTNDEYILNFNKDITVFIESIINNYLLDSDLELSSKARKKGVIISLSQILHGEYKNVISVFALMKEINIMIHEMMASKYNVEKNVALLDLNNNIQREIYNDYYEKINNYSYALNHKMLIGPLQERMLIECMDDEKDLFYKIALQFKDKSVKRAYVCVFDKPIVHKPNTEWIMPDKLYLAAYTIGNHIKSFEPDKRPTLDVEAQFKKNMMIGNHQTMMSFIIYAKEYQFGYLLCEGNNEDIPAFYVSSIQVGNILRFLEISKAEKRIQKQLFDNIQIIEEKNKVLNFISEYDQLCGIYNRRGFGEMSITLNQQNAGKTGYFLFIDLDHLKEINDCFGHTEGDFALSQMAQILQKSLQGETGFVGRIGGDEFVMMVLSDEEFFDLKLKAKIKLIASQFNNASNKEYYIECSIGVISFTCNNQFDLSQMLIKADEALYVDKMGRRSSIKK